MNVWLEEALMRSCGRAWMLAATFAAIAVYAATKGNWIVAAVDGPVALMWAAGGWAETLNIRELRDLRRAGLLEADDAWRAAVLEPLYGDRSIGKQMGVNQ